MKSLSFKLTLLCFLLFGLLFVLSGLFIRFHLQNEATQLLRRQMIGLSQSIASEYRGAFTDYLLDAEAESPLIQSIRQRLQEKRGAFNLVNVAILDTAGQVLVSTDRAEGFKTRQPRPISTNEPVRKLADDTVFASPVYDHHGSPSMTVYVSLTRSDGNRGAILAVDASADYFRIIRRIQRMLLYSGAILLVLVLLFSLIVSHYIARPIRQLAAFSERIRRGELGAQSAVATRDEIGRLAVSLNSMSHQLKEDRLQLDEKINSLMVLSGGIAHEIRNPLNGINLYADLLKRKLISQQEAGMLDNIKTEIKRINEIVVRLLDYTKPEKMNLGSIRLQGLVQAALEGLPSLAIPVELDVADCLVFADEVKMRQVLINLLQNGAEAAGEKGRLSLIAHLEMDDRLVIEVHNTGKPVPAEERGKLFTPFFTTKPKGTGLGLALCRKIVSSHGGHIELLNSALPGFATASIVTLKGGEIHGDHLYCR